MDPAILEERICGRWMHKASGRSYHVKFSPPKHWFALEVSIFGAFRDFFGFTYFFRLFPGF